MKKCPACLHGTLDVFYEVRNVPTTSNLLIWTRQQAINWPRGDVRLGFCDRCGFISNVGFDPATQKLVGEYEATQACSPTFGRFARDLAQSWIDRHDLRGKHIVEIGSGRRGEFLKLICELAGATGVGIDPIADPAESTDRVHFLAAELMPEHLCGVDFIVCRHTLEHIADVRGFLSKLSRTNAIVAVEVPDTLRVLREAAFWDIYYEHCSYFTPASLARAMQSAGIDILRHDLLYDGQYLVMECGRVDGKRPQVEDEAESVLNHFKHEVSRSIASWIDKFNGEKAVLWGAGSKAVGFLTTLGVTHEVAAVVDINPAKQNSFLPGTGHEIIAPDRLRELRPDRVIVMNPVYTAEIKKQLDEMGLRPELLSL
jgi:hypothetical protein